MYQLRLVPIVATLTAFGFLTTPVRAGDEAPVALETLKKFRGAQAFDRALAYLKELEGDETTPKEVRQWILFERGVTLVQQSRRESDLPVRESLLDQAYKSLEQYMMKHFGHKYFRLARSWFATVYAERGRLFVAKSKGKNVSARRREDYLRRARMQLNRALADLSYYVNDFELTLQELKGLDSANPKHATMIDVRDRHKAELDRIQILLPRIRRELAALNRNDDD